MIEVKVPEAGQDLEKSPKSLLERLRSGGWEIESPCGGRGSCGKCRVKLSGADVPALTADERRILSPSQIQAGFRLACKVYPAHSVGVELPSAEKNHQVLTGGYTPGFELRPAIQKKIVRIQKPTLEDPRPYQDLFAEALREAAIPWPVLRDLKMGEGLYTAVYSQDKLIGLEPGDTCHQRYGAAVDIGTTTLVVSLVDLENGRELSSEACINPQKRFGQDVLTRITYAMEKGGAAQKDLQRVLVEALNEMLARLCAREGVDPARVYEVTVAANATMMHTLLGVETASLGRSPYAQIFQGPQDIPASDIGLRALSPNARLYCLPAVSSYIGADIVAGAYVAGLATTERKVLFIDIGTNGEIVLAQGADLLACSCAAGPALEGMNISAGMRAAQGAIEDLRIGEQSVTLQVIGDTKPQGLCGSGILAAIREMRKTGLIDARGSIVKPETLQAGDYRRAYLVSEGSKRRIRLYAGEPEIFVTQGDVRQVQLAKSAILSGFMALLEEAGLDLKELDEVVVAGQFGAHLPAESLVGTGLLPQAVQDKIRYIGNSSKTGAQLALLSVPIRSALVELSKRIRYLELSVVEGYEKMFVRCSRF